MRVEAIVTHEIGHVLGFVSSVPIVDALVGLQPPKFDMGTAGSPIEAGYIQVTNATTYSAAQGYGWTSIATPNSNVDTGLGASDLERDYVLSPDAYFAIDLPNGAYDVTVIFGDLTGATHDLMGVFAEGGFIGFTSTGGANPNVRTVTTVGGSQVNVSDGQLNLRIQDLDADLTDSPIIGIEISQNPSNLGVVSPTAFDLFRLARNQGGSFSTAPRVLNTGQNVPIQVFHDGRFNVSAFNGSVDLNEDSLIDANDLISTGDIPLATGSLAGDTDDASHYKADVRFVSGMGVVPVTGITIGLMDPNLQPDELGVVTATDLRILGLIGYDVYNIGAATPTVSVTPLTTNDTTPQLTGTISAAQPGAVSNPKVYVAIPGQLGQNTASLTVDGNSNLTEAFILRNDGASLANLSRVDFIMPQDGSNGGQLFAPHYSTGAGGSASPFRDFEARASEATATGLTAPVNDFVNNESVDDLSKVLQLQFNGGNGFNPGEALHWAIDIDPGNVDGSQVAGGVVQAYWSNGLASSGVLEAAKISRFTNASPGPDTQGAFATALTPSGPVQGSIDRVLFRFNEPIMDGTFTLADVKLLEGPSGVFAPTAVNKITNTDYEVTFPAKTAVGFYNIRIGPDILDAAGNQMDQDRDGVNGETTTATLGDDIYSASWQIKAAGADVDRPFVVFSQAYGVSAGSYNRFRVVFNEAINAATFTLADVKALFGPAGSIAGAITPTAVTQINATEFDVTFPAQTALGEYQLVLSNDVFDAAATPNQLRVDGSWVKFSTPHAYQAVNNLNGTWTLPDNTLPALPNGTYNVMAFAFDSTKALALDGTGNELKIDTVAPTADVIDVTPDPRATPVSSINIVFSEAVSGFDLADLSLTRNGGGNLLSGSGASLSTTDQITYTLNGLTTLTAASGSYVLTLTAAASGVQDAAGNLLTANASDAWTFSSTTIPINGITEFQAEEYVTRTDSGDHRWWVVDTGTPGVGSFTGATGPSTDYLQALTLAGADSGAGNNVPANPTATYDISVLSAGDFALDLRAAGISSNSDSVWVKIDGATLTNAQGRPVAGDGSLYIQTNATGAFTWLDAGIWNLGVGTHTVRLSMRESGAAVDALRVEPIYPPTPIVGTTTIQAEQFGLRTPGTNHRWWSVASETPGVGSLTGATGPNSAFMQALNNSAADDAFGNASPSTPTLRYPISVSEERVYRVRVRAAGISSLSDSLWVGVPGATLMDAQGLATSGGSVNVATNSTGNFTWLDAGLWKIPAGEQALLVSMRETGTAIDALEVSAVSNPTMVSGATTLQAESYSARRPSTTHRWSVVDTETAGAGVFTGATGPSTDFLQSLTLAGTDDGAANVSPADPAALFEIQTTSGGTFDLDLRAAGISGASDSLWVRIIGGTLIDPQGSTVAGDGSLQINTNQSGAFALRNAGIWSLGAGTYTIEVRMRESGTALDSLTITPLPKTTVASLVEIQAESPTTRLASSTHAWRAVDTEGAGVGVFTGATGPSTDYLQALTLAGADDMFGNSTPAKPVARYDLVVSTIDDFDLDLRAAGISGTSDSLWVTIEGATLANAQGRTVSGGSLLVPTNRTGVFEWLDAGIWSLTPGVYTVVVSMRETGTAIDSLRIQDVSNPVAISGATTIQAEAVEARRPSATHNWRIVDAEGPGAGVFTGATGPSTDYLQSLTLAGADDSTENTIPADPAALFQIQAQTAGTFDLDVVAAGVSGTSDSLWVRILGATLVDPQGLTVAGDGSLLVVTNQTGAFATLNAGLWSLNPGVYTVEVRMRESGAGLDAIKVTPPAPTLISGLTTIEAEDATSRPASATHKWRIVDFEGAGVGVFTGATGPSTDYLQALTLAGADDNSLNFSPATPTARYAIQVAASGDFDLDLRAAGISGASDSLWVKIEGAAVANAQGLTVAGDGSVRVLTNQSGAFEWLDAGIWTLPNPGLYTVVVSMRESGTGLDALRIQDV